MTDRFLVDECCPPEFTEALWRHGHDTLHVLDVCPSAPDEKVARTAREQDRVLVTFDYGFGDRVAHQGETLAGLVLVRLGELRPAEQAARLLRALDGSSPARGWLTIVERDRIRRRPL